MASFTEEQLAEVSALESFRKRPPELSLESLEVWSAAGARYKQRCRRGMSQAQNICRGIQRSIDAGESLEQVLSSAEYRFADTFVRLCNFIAPCDCTLQTLHKLSIRLFTGLRLRPVSPRPETGSVP